MKSIKYLKLFLMTLALGLVTTSCMDDDWKDPTGDTPAFGNNNLVETKLLDCCNDLCWSAEATLTYDSWSYDSVYFILSIVFRFLQHVDDVENV